MTRCRLAHAMLLAPVLCFFPVERATAVVVADGDGTGNVTAPPDDPGWSHVGQRGEDTFGGSAVYLGNLWVLTVAHIQSGWIDFPSGRFFGVPGSAVELQNPSGLGLTANTDMKLYRLTEDPGLPPLTISETPPPVGSEVLMIGAGRNRMVPLKGWDTSDPTWVDAPVGTADVRGYELDSNSRTMRWGTNVIVDDDILGVPTSGHQFITDNAPYGHVISLGVHFEENGPINESSTARGDSGGAAFYRHGSTWELTGIMHYLYTLPGQPFDTSIFGDAGHVGNIALFSDLSAYRDQIVSITGIPEPSTLAVVVMLGLWGRRRPRALSSAFIRVHPWFNFSGSGSCGGVRGRR